LAALEHPVTERYKQSKIRGKLIFFIELFLNDKSTKRNKKINLFVTIGKKWSLMVFDCCEILYFPYLQLIKHKNRVVSLPHTI
jgi:hypothetical protein